jgi:hypothetical protein
VVVKKIVLLAGACLAFATSAHAATLITYDVESRARWGATGWEAAVFQSGDGTFGSKLDRPGAPAWTRGLFYGFELTFDKATGETSWSVDFDRSGGFGAGETATITLPSLIGRSFTHVRLAVHSPSITNGATTVENFAINGAAFGGPTITGPFDTAFRINPSAPGGVTVTGALSFAGTGNICQECAKVDLKLGTAVPEPSTWAMMVLGFGMIAGALRRQRKALDATTAA